MRGKGKKNKKNKHVIPAGTAPYKFIKRKKPNKKPATEFLDKLEHFDLALEIEWKAITPIALNPCLDWNEPANNPQLDNDAYYAGYNRRWLTVEDRAAISPFTVKSAIANAYANLMGGCYRVNTIVERHKELLQGQYPYDGSYKRYRVAMDGSSKPGIILDIKELDDGSRYVKILPVKEYYLDTEPNMPLKRGQEVKLRIVKERGYKPDIVVLDPTSSFSAIYHGPYAYGMNLSNPKGPKHKHRFYQAKGKAVEGIIAKENFYSKDKLMQCVYVGGRDQNNQKIPHWYQNLSDLKKGDFIYYEEFNNKVQHLGKNFLFKTIFLHQDTIPEGQETCSDPNQLCPRCRLFGLTFQKEEKEATGLKGRFKACTLISDFVINREKSDRAKVPVYIERDKQSKQEKLDITILKTPEGREIGRQFLFPVQGPPKPNKRDVNGYYEKDTGYLKGAKVYKHTEENHFTALLEEINHTFKTIKDQKEASSYRLRNWGEVLYAGASFRGVVGLENSTLDEVCGIIFLLHTPFSKHGYKLGLGKAFGLGSVESYVKKIWIRTPQDYTWKSFEVEDDLLRSIEKAGLKDLTAGLQKLKQADNMLQRINSIQDKADKLRFPPPGLTYWKNFNQMQQRKK
ncbi:MAG: hypothetical protein Q9M37_02615 [Desulfonauticus sp.]|nr:hypothetical protein [Desulfonauticus sp.]